MSLAELMGTLLGDTEDVGDIDKPQQVIDQSGLLLSELTRPEEGRSIK